MLSTRVSGGGGVSADGDAVVPVVGRWSVDDNLLINSCTKAVTNNSDIKTHQVTK